MKILKYIVILSFYISFSYSNEILLLHSYNKGLKWSDGISSGIEEVMKKYPHYELTTEYMDSKKIESEQLLFILFFFTDNECLGDFSAFNQ